MKKYSRKYWYLKYISLCLSVCVFISLSVYVTIHSSIALHPLVDLGRFPVSLSYRVGRTPWTGDQLVARPLLTHRTTQTQNKHIRTSMPLAGFEPTIPVFELAKTVHALDSAATAICNM
jgi:hypothetical protein